MNEIQTCSNELFGTIRTIEVDGKMLFVGSDVAKALGYANVRDAIARHCKGVVKRDTPTSGGIQSLSYITEGDVYRLCTHSKLPSAEKFENWVFEEVIPSIRLTGTYTIGGNKQIGIGESTMLRALDSAYALADEKQALIESKDKEIAELKFIIAHSNDYAGKKDIKTFTETARELNVPPRWFTQWLVDKAFVERDGNKILHPCVDYKNSGLFWVKGFSNPNGFQNNQTFVTVKGKNVFRHMLMSEEAD